MDSRSMRRLPVERSRNASSLRATNLGLVLREIMARPGRITRAEVAVRLSSTRSTISRLVDQLIEGGLVVEGDTVAGARGRPGVPLAPAAGGPSALGIEVNVDRYCLAVVDLAGGLRAARTVLESCVDRSAGEVLSAVAADALKLCSQMPDSLSLVGAHLAIPGLTDRDGRTVLRAPNLKWDGVVPGDWVRDFLDIFDVPFRVGNDIDASALTVLEELRGSGCERASLLYLSGEVGIGAAVYLDGTLMTGRRGWASELGHICVDGGGARCGCGAAGCLETVAGRAAVLSASGCETFDQLLAALEARRPRVVAALERAGRGLGQALAAALNLLDITTVVVGGYLATCLPWLHAPLSQELAERVLWASYSPIEILAVEDTAQRAARGAAMMALSAVSNDPARWLDRHREIPGKFDA